MQCSKPTILITGSDGFVGKNLVIKLEETNNFNLIYFNRNDTEEDLINGIGSSNFIIHLAGENRPKKEEDFYITNSNLTKSICETAKTTKRKIPIILFSSSQFSLDNPYGKSKKQGEKHIENYYDETGNDVIIYRPPGIFGKWCKPNYNSVVATFCNNIANTIPIKIDKKDEEITLVYIDDVIQSVICDLNNLINVSDSAYKNNGNLIYKKIEPEYKVTLNDLAEMIKSFKKSRNSLIIGKVGLGFERALYSTYLTYLPKDQFSYTVKSHDDERGSFIEMLKTYDSGQFSIFTARPGVTRGGHYHHSKTEKFLIIRGDAKYRFRNLNTNEHFEIVTDGNENLIVETIPGWSHDITNIGKEELIVALWANEIFNPSKPDTYSSEVSNE